ncbi:MAG: FkbM family methyltransferase [Proteobacteria bacterium]|nr:MAG: FkbM family methyltransferase [Pseudomonadota bacterium]
MNKITEIIDTAEFRYIALREDYYITTSLKYYGEYEPAEFSLLLPLIHEDSVVMDIGSNIGTHTLAFAKKAARGTVHAFEPQRFVYQILSGNVALNGFTNVKVHNLALGSESSTVKLPIIDYGIRSNFGGYDLRSAAGTMPAKYEETKIATIDQFNIQRLDLIKMDVESMEEDVLRGALKTLTRFRPPIYLEADRVNFREGIAPNTLRGFLQSIGYKMWLHSPGIVSKETIKKLQPIANTTDEDLIARLKEVQRCEALNMLCVPQESNLVTEEFMNANNLFPAQI